MTTSRFVLAAALALGTGCGIFDLPDGGAGDGGTQMNGFGKPTLELTVDGTHFGPAAPDVASGAQLVTTRDSFTGQASDCTFRVVVSTSSVGDACNLAFDRQGQDIDPIGPGGYQLSATTGSDTPQGTLAPIAGESIAIPQGNWFCAGNSCDGAALVISGMDTAHVEGYFSSTLQSNVGGASAQVVCSFYLPWTVYQP
jgi:hypothetical protein